jgi:hypothetical protein
MAHPTNKGRVNLPEHLLIPIKSFGKMGFDITSRGFTGDLVDGNSDPEDDNKDPYQDYLSDEEEERVKAYNEMAPTYDPNDPDNDVEHLEKDPTLNVADDPNAILRDDKINRRPKKKNAAKRKQTGKKVNTSSRPSENKKTGKTVTFKNDEESSSSSSDDETDENHNSEDHTNTNLETVTEEPTSQEDTSEKKEESPNLYHSQPKTWTKGDVNPLFEPTEQMTSNVVDILRALKLFHQITQNDKEIFLMFESMDAYVLETKNSINSASAPYSTSVTWKAKYIILVDKIPILKATRITPIIQWILDNDPPKCCVRQIGKKGLIKGGEVHLTIGPVIASNENGKAEKESEIIHDCSAASSSSSAVSSTASVSSLPLQNP